MVKKTYRIIENDPTDCNDCPHKANGCRCYSIEYLIDGKAVDADGSFTLSDAIYHANQSGYKPVIDWLFDCWSDGDLADNYAGARALALGFVAFNYPGERAAIVRGCLGLYLLVIDRSVVAFFKRTGQPDCPPLLPLSLYHATVADCMAWIKANAGNR